MIRHYWSFRCTALGNVSFAKGFHRSLWLKEVGNSLDCPENQDTKHSKRSLNFAGEEQATCSSVDVNADPNCVAQQVEIKSILWKKLLDKTKSSVAFLLEKWQWPFSCCIQLWDTTSHEETRACWCCAGSSCHFSGTCPCCVPFTTPYIYSSDRTIPAC